MWQRFNEQSLLVYQELPNGLITQFTYDAQGNMSRQWDNAGRDKTYQYDQNGKLVQFIFNQDREVIAEQDSLEITRYIRSSELIARNTDAARTYYHYVSDEIGSTTHIVDEDGIVLNHYDYDAWGNLTAQEEAVPNRFKFTGQQLDPVTQQYYLRARFYNPVIARFTQEDTYRGDGLNLYAYCHNNPVFYTDPSGNTCPENGKDPLQRVPDPSPNQQQSTALVPYDPEFANRQLIIQEGIYQKANGNSIVENVSRKNSPSIPKASELKISGTVENHLNDIVKRGPFKGELSRPYINTSGTNLLIDEIMNATTPTPDAFLSNGFRWDTPGSFRANPENRVKSPPHCTAVV